VRLRVLAQVDQDLIEASRWYDKQQAGLGDDFLDEYAEWLTTVGQYPKRFTRLETLKRTDREIRRCRLRRFPYLIIFEVLSEELMVIAVVHVRRRPTFWLNRGP